jgi:long-chain fatty acid transport protein
MREFVEGKMKKNILAFLLLVLCLSPSIWAGGWNNTLMGCRAIAMGAAFAGIADDPSAVFYNPAGLVFQEQKLNLSINGFYIMPTHAYTGMGGSMLQSKFNSTIPQIFLSYKANENVTVGFGAYAPYATGGVDWKESQIGVPLKTFLGIFSLTPTVSYRVNNKLSLGFKINFYQGVLELDTEMDPFGPVNADENGSSVSAGFGLFYKPSEKLSIGISVRGPSTMILKGKTAISYTIPDLGEIELKLNSETRFNLPWDFELGLAYRISDRFLVSTSAQYTMWSTLDQVEKTIKDIPDMGNIIQVEKMNFKNIFIVRAGFEYHIPPGLFVRAGIGVDRAASPEEALNIANIDVDKFTLLGGIGYRVGKMQIDFAFVHAQGRERENMNPPLPGRYNLDATIIGLGISFFL